MIKARQRESGVYAHKGERTYCEKGHWLGTLAKDVNVGDAQGSYDWVFRPGTRVGMMQCPRCGGDVTAGLGLYFFKVPE